jgi:hypothetical protein
VHGGRKEDPIPVYSHSPLRVEAGARRGTLTFDEVVNQTVLDPGLADDDPGQTLLSDDLTQTALGVFEVDVGGLLAVQFENLQVLGAAVLAGGLHISLVDLDPTPPFETFDPQVGNVFDVLTATSILGDGIFVAPAFSTGLSWETQIISGAGSDTLRLRVIPEPGTFSLVALGLATAALGRRRSRAARRPWTPFRGTPL